MSKHSKGICKPNTILLSHFEVMYISVSDVFELLNL